MSGVSFDPLLLLKEEINTRDTLRQVNALKKLPLVAKAIGAGQCREQLLPYIRELTDQLDDELLLHISEQLANMVTSVGGPEHCQLLLVPLEPMASIEETLVREEGVRSINAVGKGIPDADFQDSFVGLLTRLHGSKEFQARIASAAMFALAYERSTSDAQRTKLRGMFQKLASDEMPMVRSAASANLGDFCLALDDESITSTGVPLFDSLSGDPQQAVREWAVDCTRKLSGRLSQADAAAKFANPIACFALDRCVKLRVDAATHMATLCKNLGHPATNDTLAPALITLLRDSDMEVRSAACTSLPDVVAEMHPEQVKTQIVPVLEELVTDSQPQVRLGVANALGTIGKTLGEPTCSSCILPIMSTLLKDSAATVKDPTIQQIAVIVDIVGANVVEQKLLPEVRALTEDSQWRVRAAIVEILPAVAVSLGRDSFERWFNTIITESITDRVSAVRTAAASVIERLTETLGGDWAESVVVPEIREVLSKATSTYIHRVAVLYTASKLVSKAVEALANELVPLVAQQLNDKVPNVRLGAAKSLRDIVRSGVVIPQVALDALRSGTNDPDQDVEFFCEEALSAEAS